MTILCQICEKPSHGNHYGAASCRACSAFFRRAILSNIQDKMCIYGTDACKSYDGQYFCKKCKFIKCLQVGMTSKKIQYNRDKNIIIDKEVIRTTGRSQDLSFSSMVPHSPVSMDRDLCHSSMNIVPVSMTRFLGRPNCVLFCEPGRSQNTKCFLDFSDMIDKGARLLFEGCSTPFQNYSNLKKLSFGFSGNLEKMRSLKPRRVQYFGKSEFCETIHKHFQSATEFVAHFSEFQKLAHSQKMTLLINFWHVFSRYNTLFRTAKRRSELKMSNSEFLVTPDLIFGWDISKIDFSWFSEYSREQLACFYNEETVPYDKVVEQLIELEPTDIEVTYMIGQFCLHYAGKRLQGGLGDICDRLQDIISNELHDYYVNDMNISNYSTRLAKMMKINNLIQKTINQNRWKSEVADTFNVFSIFYSHPQLFEDFGLIID